MSRRYSPTERAAALAALQTHSGNIALASLHTGIPQRTLYAWRREVWLSQHLQQLQQTPPPPPPPQQAPEFEDDAQSLLFLRDQIKAELLNIAASFKVDLAFTTPYQRALVLSQLLDRLIKLDAYIPETMREVKIVHEYKYPDGSIHAIPPWEADEEDYAARYAQWMGQIPESEGEPE